MKAIRTYSFTLLFVTFLVNNIFGLSLIGTNIFEYRNAVEGHSYFEDRGDVLFMHDNLEVGARILVQQPSREDPLYDTSWTFTGIDHRWITYGGSNFSVTAGTFYETFGRGITLDLFEDRRMVLDHYLDGGRFKFRLPYVSGKAIHGKADWDSDMTLQGFEATISPPYSKLGATYLDYYGEATSRTNSYTGYAEVNLDFMNFYGEYGEKNIVGPGTDGSAMYLAADFTLFSQSLILEYKKYEDFLMRSSIISYNNPPSCIREPSYTLQSRYVHQQDLSNEQGFGATYYGYLPYDIGLEMSFAQTSQIDDSDNSYTEFYTDIYREWNRFSQHVIFQYQDEQTNKKEQFTTLILNGYYLIDAVHNITWDLEYQIENNEFTDQTYNHYMAGFEGVIIPNLSAGFEVSMIEELDIGETEPEAEASPWAFVSCDIVEGHSIIAGYGKRAGGFTCSGGICRYEKPFEGFELSIVSSF